MCCCFYHTTYTAFYSATKFNRDLSAWDVRLVAEMANMFVGAGSTTQVQSLCGYYWMQNAAAQLAFGNNLPSIAIDKDGTICHCPPGTFYQSRNKVVVMPIAEPPISQDPPPRLETCLACAAGKFSPGGKVTKSSESLCRSCLVLVSCLVLSCPVLCCLVLSCVVLSCVFLFCLVLSCFVLSCLVLSCFVLSCLVLSCLVLSCLVLSCLVMSCLVLSCLALSCLVLSCLILSSVV
jgi:hypothetical protein